MGKYHLDKAKADRALEIMGALRLYEGEWAGKPINLRDWQKDILRALLGMVDDEGIRQYTSAGIWLPTGSGKTTLIAALIIYLLCYDGEQGANIISAATTRDQASLTFNAVAGMIGESEYLSKRLRVVDHKRTIFDDQTGSKYQAIASDSHSAWGINASAVVVDELHAFRSSDLIDTLRTRLRSRRQPLFITISTAGTDKNSIGYAEFQRAVEIKINPSRDPRFLPVVYGLTDEDDWEDESNWFKASPGLGDLIKLEHVRQQYQRAKQVSGYEATFKSQYLNIWETGESGWIAPAIWEGSGATHPLDTRDGISFRDQLKGREAYIGLDLGAVGDLTAASIWIPLDDGFYAVDTRIWVPGESLKRKELYDRAPYRRWQEEGWVEEVGSETVDQELVFHSLKALCDFYDVRGIGIDPWHSQELGKLLEGAKLPACKLRQGTFTQGPPYRKIQELALEGKIVHFGNPVLAYMMRNAKPKYDANGNFIINKGSASGRIDALPAMANAVALYINAEALGIAGNINTQESVYNKRGLIFV